MTIESLIITVGIAVTLIPFLGFPLSIDNVILVTLGITTMLLGILVRRRTARRRAAKARRETYVESVPRDMEVHAE